MTEYSAGPHQPTQPMGTGTNRAQRRRAARLRRRSTRTLTAAMLGLGGLVGTAVVYPRVERTYASGGQCGDTATDAPSLFNAVLAWSNSPTCTDIEISQDFENTGTVQQQYILDEIDRDLNIIGNGAILDQTSLTLSIGGDLTVSDLTMTGSAGPPPLQLLTPADITLDNVTFYDNTATGEDTFLLADKTPATGGALLLSGAREYDDDSEEFLFTAGEGTITVTNSSFSENSGEVGGLTALTAGRIVIADVELRDNTGVIIGGALVGNISATETADITNAPEITIIDSTVTINEGAAAGGLVAVGNEVRLGTTQVVGNVGGYIGGAYLLGTEELVVTDTLFYVNAAEGVPDLGADGTHVDMTSAATEHAWAPKLRRLVDQLVPSDLTLESEVGFGAAALFSPEITLDQTTVAVNLGVAALVAYNYTMAGDPPDVPSSTLSVRRSVFLGNGVGLAGPNQFTLLTGGFDLVDVHSSVFSYNGASISAGLASYTPTELLINSTTFADNYSGFAGGGIGTVVNSGSTIVVNSTFYDNTATVGGVASYELTIDSSTFVNNYSIGAPEGAGAAAAITSLLATNSIFYNNLVNGVPGALGIFEVGVGAATDTTIKANSSLFTIESEIPEQGTNNISGDPKLGELGDNGGTRIPVSLGGFTELIPIRTMLPAATSPVIDAGINTGELPTFDQRGSGFLRVVNGAVDLGAVEVQSDPPRPSRPQPPEPASSGFTPIDPTRLLDTRSSGLIQPGTVVRIPLGSRIGTGTRGVALNVTALDATAPGYVTVYNCDGPIPNISNLNFPIGTAVPNAVISAVGASGEVCLVTSAATNLLVDLNGWFGPGFTPLGPRRLFDSRLGTSATRSLAATTVAGGSTTRITLPTLPNGTTAAVLNLTAVDAQAAGFLSITDCASAPTTSTLNVAAGQTIAGLAITPVTATSEICIYSSTATGLIVDLFGSFNQTFTPATPTRLLDTRTSTTPAAGSITRLPIGGRHGVPSSAGAVAVTVTAVDPRAAGYVTVYPCEATPPNASTLNVTTGNNNANTALIGLSATGEICIFTSGATDLIVDLSGWFSQVQ